MRKVIFNRRTGFLVSITILLFAMALNASAQQGTTGPVEPADESAMAPVIVDGMWVGQLRGVTSYPAEDRARLVRNQIISAARDETFSPQDLMVVNEDDR
mgnify:FL=1